ncbi:hypothetical protein F9K96_05280 [Brucella anthropi]|uniref:hypothetical protein n=1 Tax=Brucella anthropi TaxID=529 RepID=UPI00124D90FD|nr:hypothetical protein [Brucella anthropi]KAB2792557.1 hypothetical protein F9K96_05280 [Brucella anthropi]
MSRFKTVRNPALTEAEKQQILSRLIELKSYLNGCSAHLEIGSEDYDLLQRLGREIMSAGETIAKSEYWGKEAHSIGR